MATTEFATGSHRGASAGFLFLLGFALVATGAAFALAPHYSWQVVKIAHQASELGVQNGALFVGGLVLIGLGVVARSVSAPTTPVDTGSHHDALQADLQVLDEQLSAKIAQLRTALLQIQEGVASLASQQQDQLSKHGSHGEIADHSQDALFRLAASLDKLHAHFDERVHAVDLQLRSGFESLLNASHDLRRVLDSHGHATPAPGPTGRTLQAQAPQPQEGTIDFYQTMQKLDAIAGASEPQQGAGAGAQHSRTQPQAPFPSPGGESLDALLPEEYRDRY